MPQKNIIAAAAVHMLEKGVYYNYLISCPVHSRPNVHIWAGYRTGTMARKRSINHENPDILVLITAYSTFLHCCNG